MILIGNLLLVQTKVKSTNLIMIITFTLKKLLINLNIVISSPFYLYQYGFPKKRLFKDLISKDYLVTFKHILQGLYFEVYAFGKENTITYKSFRNIKTSSFINLTKKSEREMQPKGYYKN